METFDLAVIGAGPGGYPAAIRAAQLGARVALIEKEALGGCCLNWGCIPSKSLLASARLFSQVKSAEKLGVRIENASIDYPTAIERKNQILQKLQKGIGQLLKANQVTLFEGSATYLSRNRLRVEPQGDDKSLEIEFGKSIIATGLVPGESSFPAHPRILNSRSFFDLDQIPSRVLIFGSAIVGCEFASLLGQMGTEVVLCGSGTEILDWVDPDIRRELRRSLEKIQGVRILDGLKAQDVRPDDDGVSLAIKDQKLKVEYLIDTTNLRPAAGLALLQAQVELNEDGFIQVDDFQETSAATVYAIGDITGPPFLAHRATAQGLLAAENALGKRRRADNLVPICIYTAPEIAMVGLTEKEANESSREIKVDKFKMGALGRALTLDESSGFVKWIADPGTDQLLGAQAVGPHATELIAEATLAIRGELTGTELAETIHAHPTLSEAWAEAGQAMLGLPIHSAPPRKK